MKIINMKNSDVYNLYLLSMSLKLKGRDSRLRTRFAKLLKPRVDLIIEEKAEIAKEIGGEETKDGKIILPKDREEEYKKEIEDLMSEEFSLELDAEQLKWFEVVKKGILEIDIEFEGEKAWLYDRICDILEEV